MQRSADDAARDEILHYLDKHGVVNKDAHAGRRTKPGAGALVRRGKRWRASVDLHGMTAEAAARAIRGAVDRCREQGIAELLIIHGSGLHSDPAAGPLLKGLVQAMLTNEMSPFVRDWRPAAPKEGGDGAVVVAVRLGE